MNNNVSVTFKTSLHSITYDIVETHDGQWDLIGYGHCGNGQAAGYGKFPSRGTALQALTDRRKFDLDWKAPEITTRIC